MRQLVKQLQQAADQNRPAQRHDRRIEIRRQEQREENHADVEQRRHERWHREAVPGIEDRTGHRGQGDQQYIRKGHPQQIRGKREFLRGVDKARRGGPDHPGRKDHPEQRHQRQRQGQQPGDIRNECARRLLPLLALVFGQDRHECLGKGTLGKNTAQQIGQLEGDEERIRGHSGTESARDDGVAYKPQNP